MNIDAEINSCFIEQITELSTESRDPVEATIEYIKNRAKCNDYEAAQINILMSEQSAQKAGYKYYCRYIAGESNSEEDNADYYKSIRRSWDRFLDKFAKMSTDERVEAFTIHSGSEKALSILENSSGDKLNFITSKTEDKLIALESKAEELESKSTTYLTTHLTYTLGAAKEIEAKSDEYFDSVIKSEVEYNLVESDTEVNDRWFFNAHDNALKLTDIIRRVDSDIRLKEVETNHFIDFRENTLLQFSLGKEYYDSFKWFIISNINTIEETCDLLTINYQAYNQHDEPIDYLDEYEIKKIQPSIHRLEDVSINELKNSEYKILHVLIPNKTENLSIEDYLYYAHDLDSSSLLKKLEKENSPATDKKDLEDNSSSGGDLMSSVLKIVSGVVSLIMAAIMIASSLIIASIGLILSGLGAILNGIKNLITNLKKETKNITKTNHSTLKENLKKYNTTPQK